MRRRNNRVVLWFDDEFESRKILIQSISEKIGLKLVNAISLAAEGCAKGNWPNIVDDCASRMPQESVALIVVDDNLSALRNGLCSFSKGTSLCGALRDKFIDVPIVGVSNAAKPSDGRIQEYTYFFEFLKVSNNITQLCALVDGFSTIRRSLITGDVDHWMSILMAPAAFRTRFKKILPIELRGADMQGRANLIFQWLNNVAFKYQGELLDSLTVASMIGLREDFFLRKVVPLLGDTCEYRGVFAGFWGRWFWRHETFVSLATIVEDNGGMELSHYCEHFGKRDSRRMAVCGECGGYYTEVVAYKELNCSACSRVAAHRRCVVEVEEPRPIFSMSEYVLSKGLSNEAKR